MRKGEICQSRQDARDEFYFFASESDCQKIIKSGTFLREIRTYFPFKKRFEFFGPRGTQLEQLV